MKLDPLQIGTLSKLLDEALKLAPPRRRAWLDGLPAWHQHLGPALSRLLAPRVAPTLALPRLRCAVREPEAVRAGQAVGPYRLLQQAGEGGMAVVWSAAAPDCMDRRRLALKMPRHDAFEAGLDPDCHERFAHERDILASLAHPNIVRLHASGHSAEGRPYLAMEYVAGQPITAWARQRRLALPQRVALFLQLADAVRYVHAQGVVHQDIKPGNVLVDDFAQVRLLDFGIASRLPTPAARGKASATQPRRGACTPVYASPEQLNGGPVGRQADVYALGVVLRELVSGMRSAAAWPPQPVPAPLRSILARATAPLPQHRYAGVARMAHELRRFMALATDAANARSESPPATCSGSVASRRATTLRSMRPLCAAAGV